MRQHIPETGWVPVRANGLTHAVFDEGEGPLVIMQHGFPDTPHTFDDVVAAIVELGYRVVRPFGRGITPSEKPPGDAFHLGDLAADLVALIDALGEERAILVGHDWGAAAVWGAAHLAPQKLDRIVSMAIPHPLVVLPTPAKIWGVRHFAAHRLPWAESRFRANDFAQIRTLYERWSPGFDWAESEFEAAKNAYAHPGTLDAALGYYRRLGLWPFRGKVSTKTLVIGGLTDGAAAESDFRASHKRVTGEFRVEMLPGGHFLHREHPDEFREVLVDFLRPAAGSTPR